MKRIFISTVAMVPLVLAALTSCSQEPPPRMTYDDLPALPELSSITTDISDTQRRAIEEGRVTEDVYEEGFRNFQACMEKIGYPISAGKKEDGVYQFSYSNTARENGWGECYSFEFEYIDMGWQLSPEIMEHSYTSRVIKKCLIEYGYEPAETHPERLSQLEEYGLDDDSCHQYIGTI